MSETPTHPNGATNTWRRAAVGSVLSRLDVDSLSAGLHLVGDVLDARACQALQSEFEDVIPTAGSASVDEFVPASQRRSRGAYFTPDDIAIEIARSAARDDPARVADIACGDGALLAAIGDLCPQAELFGVEIELVFAFAAAARLRGRPARVTWGDGLAQSGAETFDAVVGNPPYVGEKGNRELFDAVRRANPHLERWFGPRLDLHYLFLHRAIDLLAPGGTLAYLTSEYWLSATGAAKLRGDLTRRAEDHEFRRLGVGAFASAPGHHSLLFACRRRAQLAIGSTQTWHPFAEVDQVQIGTPLGELVSDRQGFVSGADRVTPAMARKHGFALHAPIFIWRADEVPEAEHDLFRPLLRRSDCAANRVFAEPPGGDFVLWSDGSETEEDAARIERLLEPYRARLEARREVRNGTIPWRRIWWPRRVDDYGRPKLVVPRRASQPLACLDLSGCHVSSDCTYLLAPRDVDDEVEWLQTVMHAMNAPAAFEQLRAFGKTKGDIVEFYSEPLRRWRLPLRRDGSGLSAAE